MARRAAPLDAAVSSLVYDPHPSGVSHTPPSSAGTGVPWPAVIEALGAGVLYVDPAWCVTFASDRLLRMLGVEAAALVGRELWSALPALAGTPFERQIRDTMADGETRDFRVDYHDTRANGFLDVRVARTTDGALVLEVRDATALVRAERELGRALESVGEALFVLDPRWCVTYWNAAAERLSGLPRGAVLGRDIWHAFPGAEGSVLEHAFGETMERRAGRAFRGWHYAGTADGRGAGTYDARSYPVEGGGIIVLLTEVTDRDRQERALIARSAESDRLRELARAMSAVSDSGELLRILCDAALVGADASGAIVDQPRGDSVQCVAAAGVLSTLLATSHPLAGTMTERVLREGTSVATPHYEVESAEARALTAALPIGPALLTPLVAHGRVLGVLGVVRPVGGEPFSAADSERLAVIADHASLALHNARLLEDAQEANAAKASFLATMSHELRTPLTALTGYGELLSDGILGDLTRSQHDVVERMRSVTHHLSVMIDEILAFSSLEAGREVVRATEASSADILDAAAAVIEPLARQKGIVFEVPRPEADAPTVVTDVDKVRQILVNLAGNAVKFTDRGGVRMSLTWGDDLVHYSVLDTGPGIAPADRERIFQPFTQLDTSLTRRHGGTGLGLYISRRLAELVGGRVAVLSTPGAGSTFTLTIPLAIPPRADGDA